MQFNQVKKILFPLFLLIITLITRFCFLNWGNGYFFNPDENNMATSVAQMNFKNLNPNFFAYGQFPLFLTFLTTPLHNFSTIILTLRFWSATFSCLSIYCFYLISKIIFKSRKISYLFILLLIFTPGLIQSAHFGTTESILTFVFSANILLSLKYFQHQKKKYLLFLILISAVGLASKITAIFFVLPTYLCFFLLFLKDKKISKFILTSLIFTIIFLLLAIIFSPFNLIKFSDFKSSMIYETAVATGKLRVFYTRQFENSLPYIFQLKNIFPYANGIFIFIFSFIGFFFFIKTKLKKELLLIFVPAIIYFLYAGQLFVKWTRFMSPLFFIGPFFCLYLFKKINNKILTIILLLLMISPGIYFFKKYFSPDVRIYASNLVKSNIPSNSFILSESGNVVNFPVSYPSLQVDNFNFYELDSDKNNLNKLADALTSADYIFIPSRRVFKNQNNENYPLSQKYYRNLFSQNLGFSEIIKISNQKDLFLNSENAEETWSVFDQPTIRIYKKVNNLSPDDYQELLLSN
ncbi:MAG: glycosyltransferase family 39 protein [Candidatus Shapirobacteria bacterium]|nr:glycosyltransferase family 39 protein [Candidatus Shapirobacteria bacterium]MDD4410783.1 glycosyltransferase family 39 protein [Candidatus Shapirobacteria bacterium]